METYSVKQIAEMLKTKPETVRRWIRSGKLYAEKSSRKEGHVITERNLNIFLKTSPKYAGIAAGIVGATVMTPIAAIPVVLVFEKFLLELQYQCLTDMTDNIDIPFHFSSFSGWSCSCFNMILRFSGTGSPKCVTLSRRDKPSLEM